MHRLALGCSYGLQFIQINDLHKDSGTWHQVPPHPLQAGRTLITAHGTWEWHTVRKTYTSGRSSVTVTVYEFVLDEGGNPVSLGFFAEKSLPTGGYWKNAYKGRLSRNNIVGTTFRNPNSDRYWTLRYHAEIYPAWFGVFLKVGGHLGVGGQESATGVIANTENFSEKYGIAIETSRVGPGLGGSVGIAVGILTGFKSAQAMVNKRDSSWDFGIALAEKWSDYVNLFNEGGKYAELALLLHRLSPVAKMSDSTRKLADAIDQLGGLADIYKVFQAGDSALSGNTQTAKQAGAESINLFDIPAAGKGIELSVYKSWTEVTSVARI